MTPAASKPPRAEKRKLTLAEAADSFERAVALIEEGQAMKAEAEAVLKPWFERTKRREYDGRIEARATGGGVILDQPKVKAFLGTRLAEFQKRAKRGLSLQLVRRDGE